MSITIKEVNGIYLGSPENIKKTLINTKASLLESQSNRDLVEQLSELDIYLRKLSKIVKEDSIRAIISILIDDIQEFENFECGFKKIGDDLNKLIYFV